MNRNANTLKHWQLYTVLVLVQSDKTRAATINNAIIVKTTTTTEKEERKKETLSNIFTITSEIC